MYIECLTNQLKQISLSGFYQSDFQFDKCYPSEVGTCSTGCDPQYFPGRDCDICYPEMNTCGLDYATDCMPSCG